jgi:hypothetical protein
MTCFLKHYSTHKSRDFERFIDFQNCFWQPFYRDKMPLEYTQLSKQPPSVSHCKRCGYIHPDFLRGTVQRSKRNILGQKRHYCAVICNRCNRIVGWESPSGYVPSIGMIEIVFNRVKRLVRI